MNTFMTPEIICSVFSKCDSQSLDVLGNMLYLKLDNKAKKMLLFKKKCKWLEVRASKHTGFLFWFCWKFPRPLWQFTKKRCNSSSFHIPTTFTINFVGLSYSDSESCKLVWPMDLSKCNTSRRMKSTCMTGFSAPCCSKMSIRTFPG